MANPSPLKRAQPDLPTLWKKQNILQKEPEDPVLAMATKNRQRLTLAEDVLGRARAKYIDNEAEEGSDTDTDSESGQQAWPRWEEQGVDLNKGWKLDSSWSTQSAT